LDYQGWTLEGDIGTMVSSFPLALLGHHEVDGFLLYNIFPAMMGCRATKVTELTSHGLKSLKL
jgi:hypothetical protein